MQNLNWVRSAHMASGIVMWVVVQLNAAGVQRVKYSVSPSRLNPSLVKMASPGWGDMLISLLGPWFIVLVIVTMNCKGILSKRLPAPELITT
jgi:hypothetical protein